jgi:branched-chain amino acid transport system substrate-binding protein
MKLTRRSVLAGTSAALAMPAVLRSAHAAEAIRFGWLTTMTGPLSSPGIGFDRGVRWAADAVNSSGGAAGRQIEVITRDTQGDPTKAVNAVQELINRVKVHAVFGPTNSGEALATTPILARAKIPTLTAGVVDSLIDPKKFPNAFRVAASNTQWDDAVRNYTLKIVKAKKIAITADATGYGTSAVNSSLASFKKDGANIVFNSVIDATQTDVMPDMLRMRNAGADAIVSWTVSAGMAARQMNARAAMNWDVPIIGHPALGTGDIARLLDKPANWEKVYMIGYRSSSYDSSGKLPPRAHALVEKMKGKVQLDDTLLWWVLSGVDAVNLIADAVKESKGDSSSDKIIAYLNSLKGYPGVFGTYRFSTTEHNGFPPEEVVMQQASKRRDGAFDLAPGYG